MHQLQQLPTATLRKMVADKEAFAMKARNAWPIEAKARPAARRKKLKNATLSPPLGKARPPGKDNRQRAASIATLRERVAKLEARQALKAHKVQSATVARPLARKNTPITMGSACTGWASEAQACVMLGVPVKHIFGCDTLRPSKTFCTTNFDYGCWVDSVFDDAFARLPQVDCFSAGFPCQGFSSAGLGQGAGDARSQVLVPIVQYIVTKQPKVFFLENVKGLLNAKHVDVLDTIVETFKKAGYFVDWRVLDSCRHGVPQHRERVYIVGIRLDSQVSNFTWPVESETPPMRAFLDDRPRPPLQANARQRAIIARVNEHIQAKRGIDPCTRHCIVDVGSGRGKATYMIDMCPTITKSRGGSCGFYDTKRSTRLSVQELLRLQGTDPAMFDFSCVSRAQLGGMAGNAMTVSVVRALLRQLLPAAGLMPMSLSACANRQCADARPSARDE